VAHPDFIQRDAVQTDSCITQFRRVRVVEVTQDMFLQCSCGFFARMGLPCKHILRITNTVTATMCHVRWAKQFLFQFGNNERVTQMLIEMQRVGQGNLVPIPLSVELPTLDSYPAFLYDTSSTEGNTMLFLHQQVVPVAMHHSVNMELSRLLPASNDESGIDDTASGIQEEVLFSPQRLRLPNTTTTELYDEEYEINFDGTMKICKNLFNMVRNQPNGISMLQQKLYKLYSEVSSEITTKQSMLPTSDIVSTAVIRGRQTSTRIRSAGL
jgi:hypothetical protein